MSYILSWIKYILANEYIANEFIGAEHIGSEHMELTETEEKILSVLAWKGAKTYYDIFKKENLCSSSTAWKLIKRLEKSGLVEVKATKSFRIRGREKKLYGLTFRGLIATLHPRKESWKHLDETVKQQEKLFPLIFGKWHVFREYVDDGKFNKALQQMFVFAQIALLLEYEEHALRKSILENLCSYILSVAIDHEERISWLKAIHSDSELRQWFLKEEGRYSALADLWDLSFKYAKKPTPDWDEALEELRIRAPILFSLAV